MTSHVQQIINKLSGNDTEANSQNANIDKKSELKEKFKNGWWNVEFTKVDGTKSKMFCTLDEKLIPISENASGNNVKRSENSEVIRVFSHDRNGWRSFRVSNILAVFSIKNTL